MTRTGWKIATLAAILVAMLVANKANAQWWCDWGCYRPVCATYYPATWTAHYSPCCYEPAGAYWYLGWRPGIIRRALFGPYRWYYVGYGGWSYSWPWCYDACAYDPCCGVSGATVTFEGPGAGAAPAGPTPAPAPTPAKPQAPTEPAQPAAPSEPALPSVPRGEIPSLPGGAGGGLPQGLEETTPTPPTSPPGLFPGLDTGPLPGLESTPPTPPAALPPAASPPAMPSTTRMPVPETSGQITIWVAPEAKVRINGLPTQSTGTRRQYISYGLQPGYLYRYQIVAEMPCEVREVTVRFVRDENGEVYVDPMSGQRVLETVSDTQEVKKLQLTRTVELVAGDHQQVPFGNAFYRLTNLDTGQTQVLAMDRMLREDFEKVAAMRHAPGQEPPAWGQ